MNSSPLCERKRATSASRVFCAPTNKLPSNLCDCNLLYLNIYIATYNALGTSSLSCCAFSWCQLAEYQSPRCSRCPYPTGLRAWSSVRGPWWTSQSLPLWLWRRPFADSSGLPFYSQCCQRYEGHSGQGPAVFSSHHRLWCSFVVSRPASRLPGVLFAWSLR